MNGDYMIVDWWIQISEMNVNWLIEIGEMNVDWWIVKFPDFYSLFSEFKTVF